MKLVYKDLTKFLLKNPSKDLLSEKLFQLGHEHEIDGEIFDMELTPNRGDCLSLIGLARDLNVFFGMSDSLQVYDDDMKDLEIDFENLSPLDCPKISFLEIEIEKQTINYQPYLENFFKTIGGNKTNLFADISNYVSYELGQPTHCYDKETINNKIIFENKKINRAFNTLLGSEINLEGHNCIFSSNGEVLSLAGVMGGASSACSNMTRKVLVECAYFNPESIIGKSVKYNIISDAAHKFERGVDIKSQEKVLRRFARVVQDHVKIKSIKFKSFSQNNKKNISIPIDVNSINKILGTKIEKNEFLNYLKALGFDISNEIKVPSYRNDIKTNNDLSEEIARVLGYNNIKSSPINLNKVIDNKDESNIAKLESFLTENGFFEVINFPFTANIGAESINLDNPIDSNRKNFRTCLQDSLVENLLYNERRQKDSIKLYEISDIYTKKGIEVRQQKKLGIIISGRMGNNYKDFSKKLDANYFDKLFNNSANKNFLEIKEIPRSGLNTKKKDKIYFVEIPIEDIPTSFFSGIKCRENKSTNFIRYQKVSEFPSSSRDFSFSITNPMQVNKVINMLDEISDDLIKGLFIFDFYKNKKNNTVKLGYRFIFQSNFKTLSDEEVNDKVKEILSPILKIDGVSIPGM